MTKNKKFSFFLLLITLTGYLSSCLSPGPSSTYQERATTQILENQATPTDEVLPSPTMTPTPPPEELVTDGEMALFVGDYQRASDVFRQSLNQNPDPIVRAQAQFGLGQALYYQEEFGMALNYLRDAALTEDSTLAAQANFVMGEVYTALQRYDEALAAYQTYLDYQPGVIDDFVHEQRGDIFNSMGNYDQAIQSYEAAFRAHPEPGISPITIKIAVAYENNGDVETALALYKDIYNNTDNDYTKAEMDLRIGRIYLAQELPEQANPFFQDAVNNFPFAYDAYTALVNLVNAGVEVDEYQRGLVNYYVQNYGLAIDAFDRFLSSNPEGNADSALYFKALAVRAAGVQTGAARSEEAIALWKQLILDYPTSDFYVDAWEDIEYTYWAYLGDHEAGAETALTYVAQRPESAEAPDFLFLAGRAYERAGLLDQAAQTWQRVANEYPDSVETFRATYFAGIARVRLGDWAGAQVLFARALVLTSQPAELAAAHLWIGKCQQALGDISAALDSWKVAQTSDPFGHYSLRAEDLLIGRDPFTPPDRYNLDPNLTPYRGEAESWLRETFALPADTNLESPGLLAGDPRFQRGMAFWTLGNYRAAKDAFESMRLDFEGDPAQTFRLIPTLVEIGLYRSALVGTTNLLKSANLEGADALEAPEFFSRVRFGAYYLDWLLPIAQSEGIHPLLLLSIIRQESTYEGFIDSGAGALGLMQIIPATGEQLAAELSWPENYSQADLYRPYVSLLFGANYLKQQRNLFGGDLFAMLAAYNGGPGNTLIWKELAGSDDPDLFLETVRIEETRNYIRLINEIFSVYRWLYGEMPIS